MPPYTVSVTGLPAGLGSDPTTGTISGTPLAANEGLHLEFEVMDSGDPQQADAQDGLLVIHPPAVTASCCKKGITV